MARYGREQRGRAVDLYVRYERCAADVIRELGHPGKGALLSWYADRLEEERTRGGDAQEEAPDGRGEESRRGDYGVGKHADVRIRASGHGGSGGHAGVHGGQTRALAGPSGRTGRRCRTAAAGEEGAGHRGLNCAPIVGRCLLGYRLRPRWTLSGIPPGCVHRVVSGVVWCSSG